MQLDVSFVSIVIAQISEISEIIRQAQAQKDRAPSRTGTRAVQAVIALLANPTRDTLRERERSRTRRELSEYTRNLLPVIFLFENGDANDPSLLRQAWQGVPPDPSLNDDLVGCISNNVHRKCRDDAVHSDPQGDAPVRSKPCDLAARDAHNRGPEEETVLAVPGTSK
ncbi:hypothetical protein BJX99DRAFT_261440 [Aspergillus californicus]